ncbi:hypothetical protein ACTXT7_010514 [Hymenolepis weldensis]
MPELRNILTLPLAGSLDFMIGGVLAKLKLDFPGITFMTYENYIIVKHNISIEFVRRQDGYVDLYFAYPDLNDTLAISLFQHLKNVFNMRMPTIPGSYY